MRYSDLIGQEDVIAQLKKFGEFYASKGGTPGPVLLVGEEGMGKNTIADTFAGELGVELQEVDTAEVQVKGDLTAIMTNLRERQVLLLTNVQSLKRLWLVKTSHAPFPKLVSALQVSSIVSSALIRGR